MTGRGNAYMNKFISLLFNKFATGIPVAFATTLAISFSSYVHATSPPPTPPLQHPPSEVFPANQVKSQTGVEEPSHNPPYAEPPSTPVRHLPTVSSNLQPLPFLHPDFLQPFALFPLPLQIHLDNRPPLDAEGVFVFS